MSSHRISEINTLRIKIKEYETSIVRMTNANDNISKGDGVYDPSFVQNLRDKNRKKIDEYKGLISDIERKITSIQSGSFDQELEKQRKTNADKLSKNNKEQKEEKKRDQIKKKQTETKFYTLEKNDKYQQKQLKYELQRGEDRFYDICGTVPNYIEDNLKAMPNNKGYIWRGVWLFGQLPQDKTNQTTMFEKKGGVLYIHVYKKGGEYSLFEKQNNYKRLVSQKFIPMKPEIKKLYVSMGLF